MQPCRRLRHQGLAALAAITLLASAPSLTQAVQRTYTIDESAIANHYIKFSGTVNGSTITSQGANNFDTDGSLKALYTGSIVADRVSNTVNTIQLLDNSSLAAINNGNWKPNVGGGSNTNVAANYGGKVSTSVSGIGTDINLAGRALVANFLSTGSPEDISGGQFDLAPFDVNITSGSVDYRYTALIFITGGDNYQLAGQGGSLEGLASLSTISLGGGMLRETLTIPIDADLPAQVIDTGAGTVTLALHMAGNLVAKSDFADDFQRYWLTQADETFATANNWNPSLTPGTADTAVFDLGGNGSGGTHKVTVGTTTTNDRMRIENDKVELALNNRTYTLSNTSSSQQSVIVGSAAGEVGEMLLSTTSTGVLNSQHTVLGKTAGSSGKVTVGAGMTWNNALDLLVGGSGTGNLVISGGGDVIVPTSRTSSLGDASGSSGTASVSGSGSTWTNGQLYVGRVGGGTLTVSSAGLVSSTTAHIGFQSTGGVTVTGASSTFTNTSTLYVGEQATGTLSVQSGATLNSVNTNIGSAAGSHGTVTIMGSGSTWNNTGSAFVGGNSGAAGNQGTLNISDSATATIGSTLRTYNLGTVNFSSGKLKAAALNITQGTFNHTGGQLVVGTVTGNLNRAGGSLTPGDTAAAGLTAISSSYTQQSGATLAIELGGTSVNQFDRLTVGGSATLAGTLTVSLIQGFSPTLGNSFQILNATSGRSGTFTSQTLPTLDNTNLEWLVAYGPTSGATSLTLSVGAIGDFNRDGVVDAADYVYWRKTSGSQTQYNDWRTHFGYPLSGSGSGSSLGGNPSAVPEPAAAAFLIAALLPIFGRGRHSHRST